MADVARKTALGNGHTIEVHNVVLLHDPVEAVTDFYVQPDFRVSSLRSLTEARTSDESPAELQMIQVPVVDAYRTIASVKASYLMVDIEGGEIELLRHPLPDCVTTVCVDLHADATGIDAQSEMLAALLAHGFDLDIGHSDLPALLFRRRSS